MAALTTPIRLPTFLLAGVPKAGTTSLYHYLRQHPQVFLSPIKEPTFFGAADLLAPPYRDDVLAALARDRAALREYLEGPRQMIARQYVVEWDDYVRLFRDARDETAIGEASTAYSWLPSAAAAIRARLPDARLAFMLRDPADRLFTLYLPALWHNPRLRFAQWFEGMADKPRVGAPVVGAGRYATHLQRFMDLFPREQLRVHLYDDYRADPRAVLRDLFVFLGVDPDEPIDLSRRHNETLVPRFPRLHALRRRLFGQASPTRWLPAAARRAVARLTRGPRARRTMDPADRRMAIDYYRDEILRTADLLGRDLSAWLR